MAALAAWDEQLFRQRVLERAQAIGLASLRDVASIARVDPKYFRDDKVHEGRNIRHILQIAEAIGADPAYLLGLADKDRGPLVVDLPQGALERLARISAMAAQLCVASGYAPGTHAGEALDLMKQLIELAKAGAAAS
jgi:hypothetical protein